MREDAHLFVTRSDERNRTRTEIFDAQTLQPLTALDGWRFMLPRRMDGQPILLAHKPHAIPLQIGIVDPRTFQITHTVTIPARDTWVNP